MQGNFPALTRGRVMIVTRAAVICTTLAASGAPGAEAPGLARPATTTATTEATATTAATTAPATTRLAAVPLGTAAQSPHFQRGRALLREKNLAGAVGAFHEAVGADPSATAPRHALGELALANARWDDAVAQ